ncbi:RAMP superfamily CRISPR-associated protein [Cohnella fermenti]|uniref:CRISPR type III-associated protein domain-containing protein n=1 Tax=Cohnella fermenti TaxID=2565925 RepID=A0A4V3WGL1_9BACL|nr:RAMP superfamily CRISPR-associated protein [Cohnella fermenti]THF84696.1 hypothetical protein E6C55_01625 [Cohnella fermenti]
MTYNFVNPYNFVPFEGKCRRSPLQKGGTGDKTLTGYIQCELTTLTPIFIPNTSNDKALHKEVEQEGASYDFYSYADLGTDNKGAANDRYQQPVIPGSELRGVIRSVHEAAFNGCMSSVDLNRLLHRRTNKIKKPGLLRRNCSGEWELLECSREGLKKWRTKKLVEGQKIYLDRHQRGDRDFREYRQGRYEQEAYFHKGEFFGKKTKESAFVPGKMIVGVSEREIKRFKRLLNGYKNGEFKTKTEGHNQYEAYIRYVGDLENLPLNRWIPVYYEPYKDNQGNDMAAYFTPAMMSQEVFDTSIKQLLHEHGEYEPCQDRGNVCPVCVLFGMTGTTSIASRVRISDARVEEQADGDASRFFMQDTVWPELGEPKPSAVEFYTYHLNNQVRSFSPKYEYWTYDYKRVGTNLQFLSSKDIQLRGRKFYWHSEPGVHAEVELSSMRQRVRPVKDNVVFKFRLYFDRVTEDELARLCWTLTFNDSDCAHKIGRGKPIGFGSVRIKTAEIKVRTIDPVTGEWLLTDYEADRLPVNKLSLTKPMQDLQRIANWTSSKHSRVTYPFIDSKNNASSSGINDSASHQWFKQNRIEKTHRSEFKDVLHRIQEDAPDSVNKER